MNNTANGTILQADYAEDMGKLVKYYTLNLAALFNSAHPESTPYPLDTPGATVSFSPEAIERLAAVLAAL